MVLEKTYKLETTQEIDAFFANCKVAVQKVNNFVNWKATRLGRKTKRKHFAQDQYKSLRVLSKTDKDFSEVGKLPADILKAQLAYLNKKLSKKSYTDVSSDFAILNRKPKKSTYKAGICIQDDGIWIPSLKKFVKIKDYHPIGLRPKEALFNKRKDGWYLTLRSKKSE